MLCTHTVVHRVGLLKGRVSRDYRPFYQKLFCDNFRFCRLFAKNVCPCTVVVDFADNGSAWSFTG